MVRPFRRPRRPWPSNATPLSPTFDLIRHRRPLGLLAPPPVLCARSQIKWQRLREGVTVRTGRPPLSRSCERTDHLFMCCLPVVQDSRGTQLFDEAMPKEAKVSSRPPILPATAAAPCGFC